MRTAGGVHQGQMKFEGKRIADLQIREEFDEWVAGGIFGEDTFKIFL